MAAHIHWHAIEAGHEIGAVVEVESTQEVLVGLAAATVQGDQHTGYSFKDFTGSSQWVQAQLLLADDALGCRYCLAEYLGAPAYYLNFLDGNLMSIQDGVTTRCETCNQRASVV